jgi:hypothetical protein
MDAITAARPPGTEAAVDCLLECDAAAGSAAETEER